MGPDEYIVAGCFLITPYNMKKVICLAIFVAAALLTWHSYNFSSIGLDDANIYFKYARNLANGHRATGGFFSMP